jgi:5-methylcytosine-specific restriction endonuclease McrA
MCPSNPAPAQLTDADLIAHVETLAHRERTATVDLIASLAEFDARSLYLGQGCSSLFIYCTEVLHLSEHAAYGRIAAARTARRFPLVLDLLRDGDITLTTVGLLGPHLRSENHVELLAAARHKSKREVELLVAAIRPQPAVEATIRRLPHATIVDALRRAEAYFTDPRTWEVGRADGVAGAGEVISAFAGNDRVQSHRGPSTASRGDTVSIAANDRAVGRESSESGTQDAAPEHAASNGGPYRAAGADPADSQTPGGDRTMDPSARSSNGSRAFVVPESLERYRIQFTASQQTYDKLRRAQDLLRHVIPDGNPSEVLERALTLLVDHLERTRLAATKQPRQGPAKVPAPGRARRIPATVRRQVWARDGGRCAFVGARGRCTARGFLEFHHVVPYAAGGAASVENIQLRCRAHNAYEARQYYGPERAAARRDVRADSPQAPSARQSKLPASRRSDRPAKPPSKPPPR